MGAYEGGNTLSVLVCGLWAVGGPRSPSNDATAPFGEFVYQSSARACADSAAGHEVKKTSQRC
jgi:hypothetical protein